jgi:hypothetical protein
VSGWFKPWVPDKILTREELLREQFERLPPEQRATWLADRHWFRKQAYELQRALDKQPSRSEPVSAPDAPSAPRSCSALSGSEGASVGASWLNCWSRATFTERPATWMKPWPPSLSVLSKPLFTKPSSEPASS